MSLIFSLPYCHTSMQCFFFPRFSSLPFSLPFPYFLFFFFLLFRYKRKTSSSRKVTFKILNEYPLFTSKIINVSLNPCRNVHSCIIIIHDIAPKFSTIIIISGSTRSSARNFAANFLSSKGRLRALFDCRIHSFTFVFLTSKQRPFVEYFPAIEIVAPQSPSLTNLPTKQITIFSRISDSFLPYRQIHVRHPWKSFHQVYIPLSVLLIG